MGVLARAPRSRHFEHAPRLIEGMGLLRALNASAHLRGPQRIGARPLVLYGAGNLGRLARDHLASVGQPIAAVVDVHARTLRADPAWAGIPLLAPDEVPDALKREALLALCVVTLPFAPLAEELARQGWATCVPFYDIAEAFRDRHPLSNGWFADPLTPTDLEDAGDVLDGWWDEASRAHHLRFAAWRLAREEWDFADARVEPETRFFIPEVRAALRRTDSFLDGGAHHGSVTERMLQISGLPRGAIWAIEPDAASHKAFRAWAGRAGSDVRARLHLMDRVLTERDAPVPFHSGLGYASQVAATGTLRQGTPIDALDLAPGFIKLHLEGGELAALKGARETLRRHRPVIAATVYHNADGLVRTPHWLMTSLDCMRTPWCSTSA
ncbi:MAG: hypothetical protein B7Z15_11600 [Rhizobiales bacterium 32-66-8]|nr:MAG: hypothetical protein B7Z15_11600 [Rhizobiales bacterium 32-66-8]